MMRRNRSHHWSKTGNAMMAPDFPMGRSAPIVFHHKSKTYLNLSEHLVVKFEPNPTCGTVCAPNPLQSDVFANNFGTAWNKVFPFET